MDLLENMGYPTDYAETPSFNDIKRTANSASILIIHGHGERGRILIRTSPTEESYISVWSESLEQIPGSTWDHITFVFFATCYSGKSYGCSKSMVDKAYELGADCVIGFNNTVSDAEDFLNYMVDAIVASENSITIGEAKIAAEKKMLEKYKINKLDQLPTNNPASPTNLYVKGDQSIHLDLTR